MCYANLTTSLFVDDVEPSSKKASRSEHGGYGSCECGRSFFKRAGSMKRKCDECLDASRKAVKAVQRRRSAAAARLRRGSELCKTHSAA